MQPLQTPKLSDVIAEKLRGWLLDGDLQAGQRLPSERELAEQFAVSRPSLREAIQKLEAQGLLCRKQGGGTFVAPQLAPSLSDPLLQLLAAEPESQFDLLEFRHALEGMAAFYAALRGTEEELQTLQQKLQDLEDTLPCGDIEGQAKALVAFYLRMAEVSGNRVLQHVMRGLLPLLQENIQANLAMLTKQPQAAEKIHRQRQRILAAIVASDPEGARKASNEHLAFIEATLLEMNSKDSKMLRALRRLETKP